MSINTDETSLVFQQPHESLETGAVNEDSEDETGSLNQRENVTEQQDSNDPDPSSLDTKPLSKKAQKRLLKTQRYQEHKKERREREKAAKRAKKAAARAVAAVGADEGQTTTTTAGEDVLGEEDGRKRGREGDEETGREAKRRRRGASPDGSNNQAKKNPFGAKIVVDLGFDEKMTDREIISMVSQCAYCYSSNRKSDAPFSALLFTSLNGRTKQRFDLLNTYQNWRGVEWWEEGYERLWQPSTISADSTLEDEQMTDATNPQDPRGEETDSTYYTCPVTKVKTKRTTCAKENVVYLTADSNDELLELDPETTYIIGGIVDKNRYKALCENKAQEQGIRTARLPIGIYLKELPTRKVLTVNQVFDILIKWIESRDWKKALYDVMPLRKFENVSKAARRARRDEEGTEPRGTDEPVSGENLDANAHDQIPT